MGTPEFAKPTLEILCRSGHKVVGVFCQPDRPTGRGQILSSPPIKDFALSNNIPVYQPSTLKDKSLFNNIETLNPDIIIVVAYGQLLPKEIINFPRYKCVNLHASLLPKFRGAAPINWALIRGEIETGITTMLMDEGLDTGDILLQEKIPITSEDNAMTLHDKLSQLGAQKILETIEGLDKGEITSIQQEHGKATSAPKLKKINGLINWDSPALDIFNLVRGTYKWPGAFTFYRKKRLKILKTVLPDIMKNGKPASILYSGDSGIEVAAGVGSLLITKVQMEGKPEMTAHQFSLGCPFKPGEVFRNSLG